jgi:CheY-like chemotaxis protein
MAKPRILLVEDNNINQVVAQKILAKAELTADVAGSAEAALEKLSTAPFDLVLMDVRLPGMDGMDATRRIRSGDVGPENRDIEIIALTAYASEEDRNACLSAGMNDYLSKPLDINSFLETVKAHLSPADDGDEAAAEPADTPAADGAAPDTPIFDAGTLSLQLGGDDKLAEIAVTSFLGLLPRKLAHLHDAVNSAGEEDIERAAHALAGAAANVAAVALQTRLRSVEDQARRGNTEAVRAGMTEIDTLAEETRLAMERFRSGQ